MKSFTLAALLPVLAMATDVRAQCGGAGPATLEFIAQDNKPIGPGSRLTMRLTGEPNSFFCLICDFGDGPTKVPNLGTFCLDLSPNLVEFVATFPASGVLEIPVTIPQIATRTQLCCQWFGVNAARSLSGLSNVVCVNLNEPCKGGVTEISFVTRMDVPSRFPATITATATGRQGANSQAFATRFTFDPNSPPSFPVTTDNRMFVEKAAVNGDKLDVSIRIRAPSSSRPANRLNNNMVFSVRAGNVTNASPTIHLSCSQPIGVGMRFGSYTVTRLIPRG